MRVKLEEVCKRIYAGGDVPKDRYSEEKTEDYKVPIFANAEKDEGLYGYTDEAREKELSITVAARGTIGYTVIRREPFLPVVRLITVVPDLEKVSERYLFYALKMCKPQSSGTSIPQLTVPDIKKNTLNLLDIAEQESIANRLDKLNGIIKLRTEVISKMDELIRARFVEMFVSKNYPREELDNLSYGKGEYGAQSASVEYNSSRPRYVRITDIKEDGSLNDDVVCSANVEDDKLYKLKYGDFCFARMGATVGKTYAYRGGNQIFAGYLIRYKLNLNRIIPEYLYEFTRLHEYRNWVSLNQSGAAQPGINAKKYGSLRIPVAPLEEQRVFAKFVEEVNKSKVEVKKALDEAQLLFDSLMQKYFG